MGRARAVTSAGRTATGATWPSNLTVSRGPPARAVPSLLQDRNVLLPPRPARKHPLHQGDVQGGQQCHAAQGARCLPLHLPAPSVRHSFFRDPGRRSCRCCVFLWSVCLCCLSGSLGCALPRPVRPGWALRLPGTRSLSSSRTCHTSIPAPSPPHFLLSYLLPFAARSPCPIPSLILRRVPVAPPPPLRLPAPCPR